MPGMTSRPGAALPVAIVGAGFSGTMVALHLLTRTRRTILLCERGERFARGAAYGTGDPGHLLNVRASNMSAFPDRPHHFVRWLNEGGHTASPQVHVTAAGTFVSRQLYGSYLTALLGQAVSEREGAERLILVPDEAVDVVPAGTGFRLVLDGGRQPEVAGVVLAAGNLTPAPGRAGAHVTAPWNTPFAEGLDPAGRVVVIGSGLSMVDIVLQLRRTGFRGRVTSLSRRGLLPQSHAVTVPWPTPAVAAEDRGSPVRLLRRLRRDVEAAAAQGVGWQSVIDGIRPFTAALWQDLGPDGRARFLRHARTIWDVHRHRMAVPVAESVAALVRDGVLRVQAGRVLDIEADEDRARVTYQPRGSSTRAVLEGDRVINAMGPVGPERCGDALFGRLVDRGLARTDDLRLGLDLTPGCGLVGRDGTAVPGLWAVGPLGRGVFWECTAVPDIREQAVRVADGIAAALASCAAP